MASVYLSSTYEDLKDHRDAVYRALRRLGHDVRAMEDYVAADDRPMDRCLADVSVCEVYVGVVAFRYGYVPTAGNPDGRSITELEYRKAEALKKPRLVFLLRDEAPWPPKFVDAGEPRQRLQALRDELGRDRLASFFSTEHELAELVGAAVTQWEKEQRGEAAPPAPAARPQVGLRPVEPPGDPPEDPYPLLGPYRHRATFAGREREIDELERLVRKPPLVLCLHAASGAGKSSLLLAGLAPRLRDRHFPVCLLRDPGEPRLAQRLVAGVLDVPPDFELHDNRPQLFAEFAAWMAHAKALAQGKPPVLILDQVDDFLRLDGGRDEALARLGPLMAATAQRLRGESDFCCRWVLCYRGEFHHEIDEWLRDVLAAAKRAGRSGLEALPHDLSSPDRVHSWPVPVTGTPPAGESVREEATGAFLAAIAKPLTLESSPGRRRYPVRFAEGSAERLAAAFAEARERNPKAPLVPELQVVLGDLLDGAIRAPGAEATARLVDVPADPQALQKRIDDALAKHVRRALDEAFPLGGGRESVRRRRTEALTVLSELTDAEGRRAGGLKKEDLLRALPAADRTAADGKAALKVLASPRLRLIVRDERGLYALSHDSLARVVRDFLDERRAAEELDLDPKLLELRRLVATRSEEYARATRAAEKDRSGHESALALSSGQYSGIEQSAPALLFDEPRQVWWEACQRYRRVKRTRAFVLGGIAGVVLLVLGVIAIGELKKSQNRSACGSEVFSAARWCQQDDALVGFVKIEAGSFVMGSNKVMQPEARENEVWPEAPEALTEPREFRLDTYYIGRHEVTVGQFKTCVDDGGCRPEDKVDLHAERHYPVTNVSWREALEYCAWLESRLKESNASSAVKEALTRGWRVSLPSEAEWEKAARGTDGRIYPWGHWPDRTKANYESSGLRPVGAMKCGDCVYGLQDMIGNVWEWTRSRDFSYPYDPDDGREDLNAPGLRVVRGGAFSSLSTDIRAPYRLVSDPDHGYYGIGFRVVISRF